MKDQFVKTIAAALMCCFLVAASGCMAALRPPCGAERDDAPLVEEVVQSHTNTAALSGDVDTVSTNEAPEAGDAAYDNLELLTEVMLHIRKHYVEEKTYKDITYGALHGMLQAMDPHSSFLEPEEYDDMREDTSGTFSGIGIHIGLKAGMLTVIAPIEDTPGFRAGLQAGDHILEIDGEPTTGITLREAVSRLRGEKDSSVTIRVRSKHATDTREVTIVRDDITVPSVKGARIIRDGVGYVRITQFAKPTAEALQAELGRLEQEGMRALVIDLRSNPGGLLRSAIEISSKFLKRGEVVVTTRGREEKHDEVESRAGGAYHFIDHPLVVLIDGGSASASEIVAGALQDHHRAILIGDTTFGKGSVQSVIPLSQDRQAAIRLTIAYYYTPSGRLIHEEGIEPDIRVYVPPEEWRRVQIRRSHMENPTLFEKKDIDEYKDVIDQPLERAVDLLHAVRLLRDR